MATSTVPMKGEMLPPILSDSHCLQAGGLQGLQSDEQALRDAVEFASACGAFTTTQPGGIDAQPSEEQATDLLNKLSAQR